MRDCSASGNGSGLLVSADTLVAGCQVADNSGGGVLVRGEGNRIEDNHVSGNGLGVQVTGRGPWWS